MRSLYTAAALVFMSATGALAEKPVLLWQNLDLPPLVIAKGPDAGTGFVDQHLKWAEAVLDDFDHRLAIAPTARILADAAEGRAFCTGSLLRTPEREKYLRYSEWTSTTLPNALIVRRAVYSQLEPFIEAGSVDLAAVLKSSRFRLGYARGAFFGPAIDATLADNAAGIDVTLLPERRQAIAMVVADRIDLSIAYPAEIEWLVRSEGLAANYRVVAIKGVPRAVGHLACTHSVPAQVIDRLNAAIAAPGARDILRRAYANWLDAETSTLFLGQ